MTEEECNDRALRCAANAALAQSEPVSLEFLRLAAQWRAMAARVIRLEIGGGPIDRAGSAVALPLA